MKRKALCIGLMLFIALAMAPMAKATETNLMSGLTATTTGDAFTGGYGVGNINDGDYNGTAGGYVLGANSNLNGNATWDLGSQYSNVTLWIKTWDYQQGYAGNPTVYLQISNDSSAWLNLGSCTDDGGVPCLHSMFQDSGTYGPGDYKHEDTFLSKTFRYVRLKLRDDSNAGGGNTKMLVYELEANYTNVTSANATSINLYLNGTQGNISMTYGSTLNATATINTTGLEVDLWKDNVLIANATDLAYNITTWGAGTYNITASYAGNATFSSNSTTYYVTINNATNIISIYFTNSTSRYINSNMTVAYNTTTNYTGFCGGLGTCGIFQNGTAAPYNNTNITLAASTYMITVNSTGNANYSANSSTYYIFIPKTSTTNTLTSSAGWNIPGNTQTTITCSNSLSLATVLTKDSITIANPYTAILPFGMFTFSCAMSHQNYTASTVTEIMNVLVGGVGCTNSTTYIYSAWIPVSNANTTIDFTSLASSGIVKGDLSDVLMNTSGATANVSINATHKFLQVNSSGISGFTLYFGNYFVNNSYSNGTLRNETMTSMTYSQNASFYYTTNILNENNGSALVPPLPTATSTKLTINCAGGSNTYDITNSTFSFPTTSQLSSARVTVAYSPTSIYYRDLLVSSPIQPLNFYMADATENQVVQMLVNLQDNTATFRNAALEIKKLLGGSSVMITNLLFDSENKAIIYLENGGIYQIYVTSGSSTRGIGDLFADNVNLVKTITINPVLLSIDNRLNYSIDFNNQTGVITFVWYDPSSQTTQINMSVYNSTDNSLMSSFTSTNSTLTTFTYSTGNRNGTYRIALSIAHSWYNQAPQLITMIVGGLAEFASLINLPSLLPAGAVTFAAGLLIVTVPMFFDGLAGAVGGIVACIIGVVFCYLGWWPGGILAIVGTVFAFLNKLGEKRRRIEEQ